MWSDFKSPRCCCYLSYSLVGLFPLRALRTGTTVVSLNDEGVFLLQLAVHQATGPQLALARCTVQHHCLKWSFQPVDVERTDLPWKQEDGREEKEKEGEGTRSALTTVSQVESK